MAKLVEYDNTGVEASGGGTDEPKPAVYPAVIRICEQRETKADGSPANDLRVALDLGGSYKWLFSYIGLGEAAEWKMAEFTRALGLKEKGKFDPAKQVGKMVRVKVNPGTYEGAYSANAGRLMKAMPDDEIPEATASSDDDDADANGEGDASAVATVGEDGEFVPSREGEEFGSYEDWDDSDLESEVQDRELTVAGGRGKKRDKWIKTLREDDNNAASEPGDDDYEEGEQQAAGDDDDYDTWEAKELEAEFKDRELELPTKPRGKGAADRYKKALITALRTDDEENPFEDEEGQ